MQCVLYYGQDVCVSCVCVCDAEKNEATLSYIRSTENRLTATACKCFVWTLGIFHCVIFRLFFCPRLHDIYDLERPETSPPTAVQDNQPPAVRPAATITFPQHFFVTLGVILE